MIDCIFHKINNSCSALKIKPDEEYCQTCKFRKTKEGDELAKLKSERRIASLPEDEKTYIIDKFKVRLKRDGADGYSR